MKRNAFALSVAAAIGAFGLAGVATAGVIPGGAFNITGSVGPVAGTTRAVGADALVPGRFKIGHILLGEYFTTQNGNATTLHITNTDQNNGKAVKVRFRSAQNSDDVFDFTILMSPGDMWTGGIVADEATGRSKMITADTSCTLPPVVNGELFPTDRLPSSKTDAQKASMTREGYIEVLNMANIPSDKVALGKQVYDSNRDSAGKTGALYRATKHSAGKPTCDSAVINTLRTNPTGMQAAADMGLDLPTGTLFANVNIVNVPNTASYANQAAAVVAAAAGVSSTGNIVFYPQIGGDAGNVDAATSDPLLRQSAVLNSGKLALSPAALPLIKAQWFDLPDLSTPYITGLAPAPATANDAPLDQANKLTAAMNSTSVINEFNVDPSLAGATDWVFSMPTRRYHVAMDYDHAGRGLTGFDGRVFTSTTVALGSDTNTAANNTFNTQFNATNTALDTDKIKICVNSGGITMFDREETTKTSGFVISPGTASTVRFCGETSVLSFNLAGSTADPSVLGSKETLQIIGTPYKAGWAALATAGNGSPVIGSAYMRLTNAGARAGVSGNYGLVYPHR